MDQHLLSYILFAPLVGVAILLLIPGSAKNAIKIWANIASFGVFLISLPLAFNFDKNAMSYQMVERGDWIPSIGAKYLVGVDGISMLLVMLTTLVSFLAILSSWNAIDDKLKEYYAMFLLLETGMLGVFISLDFFLFYVFWELVLVPMYFIIGVWGGPRKLYAAIKFFLYTLSRSVLMLLGILTLYFQYYEQFGVYTFEIAELMKLSLPLLTQQWVFWAFFIGFAIKVPMFPFHTWLPDAHVEAPTAGSVILAAVLLKMGTYGFLRFSLPLLPNASTDRTIVQILAVLSIIGIVYGALVSLMEADWKKLIAYSSVAHLGFVMLGIWALTLQSVQGALLVMINHGISTGALFFLAGMLYERRHTRLIDAFGGIAKVVPLLAATLTIVSLSSIALPGTNGFVGEFLVLLGSFRTYPRAAIFAAAGVIVAAMYLLPALQRIIYNPLDKPENGKLPRLSPPRLAVLRRLFALIDWNGVRPPAPPCPLRPAGPMHLPPAR